MSSYLDRAISINEQRKNELAQLNSWIDDIGQTPMNEEQRSEFEKRTAAIDGMSVERDALMERSRIENENEGIRDAQEIAFGADVNEERQRRNENNEIRSFIAGNTRHDTVDEDGRPVNAIRSNVMAVHRERELLRAGASPEEIRTLAWNVDTSVGSTVPTILDRSLYTVLEQSIAALRMPTMKVNTSSGGPMEFPTVPTLGIATTVSPQTTTFGGTDPGFNKVSITPVKVGQLVTMASEVVTDPGVDVVSFVSQDIGRAVGRLANAKIMDAMIATAYVGSGGTASTGGSLVGPTANNLIDLEHSINDSYRNSASTGYVMNDLTAAAIRKLKDGAGGTVGNSIWQTSTQGGIQGLMQPDRLYGRPVWTDPGMASMASNAKIVGFGAWDNFIFRSVGSLMVERNDSIGFANDTVAFRGRWRVGGVARDVTAANWMKMSVS